MPDYSLILTYNYFGNQWTLSANDYETLQWLPNNPQPKPTQAQLDSLWASTQTAQAKADCKAQAKQLLSDSDWSVLPDVQITNKADFDNYRAILRGYVISPVTDPTWPVMPDPIWG